MQPTIHIMASGKRGTLYVGVTGNLVQRVWQHKQGVTKGFSDKFGTKTLVYYEQHVSMESAIQREKQIKKWRRQWKLNLVFEYNPDWNDLWDSIIVAS
ncbi:MAG: GIY-YIG nuclease family protein [Oleiphilus sp.]